MNALRLAAVFAIACTLGCNAVTAPEEPEPGLPPGVMGSIQVEQVTLHDRLSYRDMEVRGVVRNTGEVPLFVEVRTAILDEQCQELGVWWVPVPRVPAGGVAPFQSYVMVEGKKHLARLAEAHVTLAAPAD